MPSQTDIFRRCLPTTASLVAISILLAGCDSDVVWNKTIRTPENWDRYTPVEFAMQPSDSDLWKSAGHYSAELSLRYSADTPEKTLPLVVEIESLEDATVTDTIAIPLFDGNGTPLGAGRFSIYEQRHTLFVKKRIPDGLRISISPVGDIPMEGISYATMIIRPG